MAFHRQLRLKDKLSSPIRTTTNNNTYSSIPPSLAKAA